MLDQTYDSSFQVQKIVDQKQIAGEPYYLVKWKGYGSDQNTWEPTRHLNNAKQKLQEWECYKSKEINYLEYYKLVDKIELNQQYKKKIEEPYHFSRHKEKTISRRQTSKPYQIMPTSVIQNQNQKLSIFEKVQSKRYDKKQKSQRKKKQLAIFQQRLKCKPKVWQQYLNPQNKIAQNCQQIKNVVSQALEYHKKHLSQIKKTQTLEQKKLNLQQKSSILMQKTSTIKQNQNTLEEKQKRRNSAKKLKKMPKVQKQQKDRQKVDELAYLNQKYLTHTVNQINLNKQKNCEKQIKTLNHDLKQENHKKIQMILKRSQIHPCIVQIDTLKLTQDYLKIKYSQDIAYKEGQKDKKVQKVQIFDKQQQASQFKKLKMQDNRNNEQRLNSNQGHLILTSSCQNALQTYKNLSFCDFQNQQKNQINRSNLTALSLSPIKYLSQELSHSIDSFSDLKLNEFIHSNEDCYFPFQEKNHYEKFNSVEEKQSYKEKDDEKLYQTKSSLLGNGSEGVATKIVKILSSQGQKYAKVEFENKLSSQKIFKIMNYQQVKMNLPELLLNYFQGYMLTN